LHSLYFFVPGILAALASRLLFLVEGHDLELNQVCLYVQMYLE